MRGSCLCDTVAYEVTSPIKAVHNCHCSRCRRARAAARTALDRVRDAIAEDTWFEKFGLITVCAAGGSGFAMVVER